MSLSQRIIKNTGIQVIGKIAGTLLSIITASLVLRYLGPSGNGQYTTVFSFLQVFGILMDLGLYIVLIKKIAQLENLDHPIVHNIFTIRILSGVVLLGSAPFFAWTIGQYNSNYSPQIVQGIALTALFFFFISLNQLLSGIFQKALQTKWIAIGEALGKIVLLGTTILFITLDVGLLGILLTLSLSSATNFAITFFASRKHLRIHLAWDFALWKKIMKEAWPTAVSIIFGLIYFKGDTVLLTFYEGETVIGWYGAPYKILEVLVTFPAMFAGLALPVITRAWQQKDTARFQSLLQRSVDALALIAIPMIFGILVLAPYVIHIIADERYMNSVPILRILIIATAAIFLGTLLSYIALAIDKQRSMMWGYGFIAVTALTGYLVLIPRFSTTGAAWVTVYSEVSVVCIALFIILRATRVRFSVRTILKSLLASLVMYGGLTLLASPLEFFLLQKGTVAMSSFWLSIVMVCICIPVGILIYSTVVLLVRGVNIAEMKNLLKK